MMPSPKFERDPRVQALLDELPNWHFYVQRQRERALRQREIAERAFGDVVRQLKAERAKRK